MDFSSYKEPPKLICPTCSENIVNPSWRLKCLVNPNGLDCPCGKVKLKMGGNYWFGLFIGCTSLLIGGRLWSTGFPLLLCILFLAAGIGAIGWGLFTSSLVVVPPNEIITPNKKQ
jgi:hypothetical protein